VQALALFIARRLAILLLLLLVTSFGAFLLLYLSPGSPETVLLGDHPSSPAVVQAIRAKYNLDDPFVVQYGKWLEKAATLDFGTSIRTDEPVTAAIGGRLGLTVDLALMAFGITVFLGISLGMIVAVNSRTVLDRSVVGVSVLASSAPAFASGILLLYLFAVKIAWFPAYGNGSGVLDRIWHLVLPAIALALPPTALVLKLTRAAMLRELEKDYVVFALSRGVEHRRVITAYVLRNALVPVVTAAGLIVGGLLTGAVLVEVTFSLAGVGSLLVESALFHDVPVVQGLVMLFAATIVLANLAADVLYVLIDPRIRFSGMKP
jgi:peptide/nickel transport system permease protein